MLVKILDISVSMPDATSKSWIIDILLLMEASSIFHFFPPLYHKYGLFWFTNFWRVPFVNMYKHCINKKGDPVLWFLF